MADFTFCGFGKVLRPLLLGGQIHPRERWGSNATQLPPCGKTLKMLCGLCLALHQNKAKTLQCTLERVLFVVCVCVCVCTNIYHNIYHNAYINLFLFLFWQSRSFASSVLYKASWSSALLVKAVLIGTRHLCSH